MVTAVLAALGLIAASGAASAATKAPAQLAAAGGSTLMPGEALYAGQSLVAGNYTFAMQADGNFVLYYGGSQALWQSHTYGHPNAWVTMQGDGNLVVYTPGPIYSPLWQSGTYGHGGSRLVLQTDGNAVVYSTTNWPLWHTDTAGQGGTSREQAAINWTLAHATSQNWTNLCETEVEEAYGTIYRFPTASADYNWQRSAGQIHTDRNAPRGTLVFFSGNSPSGHVGLAAGDGANYYTTDSGTIHLAPYSEGGVYYGWAYAPANW